MISLGIIKLPKMNEKEIKEAKKSQNLCRIAFIDGEYPYISPFQYVLIDDVLFFHFTDYGKKKKILSKNANVCVSIEKFEPDLSSYYFISLQGKLELVEDNDLKNRVINQMTKSASNKYSRNFLNKERSVLRYKFFASCCVIVLAPLLKDPSAIFVLIASSNSCRSIPSCK